MKKGDKKRVYIRERSLITDTDGGTIVKYDTAIGVSVLIQPSTGRVNSESYGEGVSKTLTIVTDTDVNVKEKDGICVYVTPEGQPDYTVISVEHWLKSVNILAEKVLE